MFTALWDGDHDSSSPSSSIIFSSQLDHHQKSGRACQPFPSFVPFPPWRLSSPVAARSTRPTYGSVPGSPSPISPQLHGVSPHLHDAPLVDGAAVDRAVDPGEWIALARVGMRQVGRPSCLSCRRCGATACHPGHAGRPGTQGLGCSARAALRTPEEHLHLHRAADLRSQRHPMVLPPASSLCPSCPSRTPSRISHPISRLPTSGRRRRRRPSGLRARGTISSVGLGRARQGAPAVRRGVAAARARRKRARARLRPRAARPVAVVCSQPAAVCARNPNPHPNPHPNHNPTPA